MVGSNCVSLAGPDRPDDRSGQRCSGAVSLLEWAFCLASLSRILRDLEERHLIDGKTAEADQRRGVGLATLRSWTSLLAVLEKSLSASGVTDGKDGAPDL
jgi:hypothetical protein